MPTCLRVPRRAGPPAGRPARPAGPRRPHGVPAGKSRPPPAARRGGAGRGAVQAAAANGPRAASAGSAVPLLPAPPVSASPGRGAGHVPAGVGPRGGACGEGGREPPRDSGPLGLKAPRPSGGGRWGLQAALRTPGGLECMSRREPTGRRGASAPGTLLSPAAVARETRSRRRKELTRFAAPPASLVRTQWAAGVGGPGGAGLRAAETPRAGPKLPGERHDGSWRGSFKAEGSGPSCGAALARPGRSRGFTRSSAGAAFWGRGRLGRVARGWVAGTCARASRGGGLRRRP